MKCISVPLVMALPFVTERTPLKPGFNFFSAEQDVAAQAPLAVLGGLLGSDSIGAILAQTGASFAANSVLLKFSRNAEREADLMGTQILYDSGYDPRAMARFFQKLEVQSGSRGSEFFSSHPNPGNRVGSVNQEISRLGSSRRTKTDSADFQRAKGILKNK